MRKTNEQGMVSIIVSFIMMIVISITVLSFAQIIRREQRQALDNQLSSQAFYAAETGVNDARKVIETMRATGIQEKTSCKTGSSDWGDLSLNNKYQIDDSTSYTCLLVDPAPKALTYELAANGGSKVTPIESTTGSISKLRLSWAPQKSDNGSDPLSGCLTSASGNVFKPQEKWGCTGYGVIRFDLVPVTGYSLNNASLMASNYTVFIVPTTNGSTTAIYAASNGGSPKQENAKCTTTECTITVDVNSSQKFYARMMSLYRGTPSFKITSDDTDVRFKNSQVVIDSTGKAQDVLRRIQVAVSAISPSERADYALQSGQSICKQFTTFPGRTNNTKDCDD